MQLVRDASTAELHPISAAGVPRPCSADPQVTAGGQVAETGTVARQADAPRGAASVDTGAVAGATHTPDSPDRLSDGEAGLRVEPAMHAAPRGSPGRPALRGQKRKLESTASQTSTRSWQGTGADRPAAGSANLPAVRVPEELGGQGRLPAAAAEPATQSAGTGTSPRDTGTTILPSASTKGPAAANAVQRAPALRQAAEDRQSFDGASVTARGGRQIAQLQQSALGALPQRLGHTFSAVYAQLRPGHAASQVSAAASSAYANSLRWVLTRASNNIGMEAWVLSVG